MGSAQAQAGTIMHELGHNLDLSHAGLATQPNCMPNYQSVMNYLYQTRGLTTASGEHVDYSFGNVPYFERELVTHRIVGQPDLCHPLFWPGGTEHASGKRGAASLRRHGHHERGAGSPSRRPGRCNTRLEQRDGETSHCNTPDRY